MFPIQIQVVKIHQGDLAGICLLQNWIIVLNHAMVSEILSFNQDTTHVLNIIKEITDSCFSDYGYRIVVHCLDQIIYLLKAAGMYYFTITEWTLNNNFFLFQDQFNKQIKGTAMGACFASNYAHLFLGFWEKKLFFRF